MTATVELEELMARWPQVLESMRRGEVVVVTDHAVPQARITPIVSRRANLQPGSMVMSEDFQAPLPETYWLGQS
jgi:antitoxin (DNA-binding transcriptional repressor) of toxin-antitoxin stability system